MGNKQHKHKVAETKRVEHGFISHVTDEAKEASDFYHFLVDFMGANAQCWDTFMEKDIQETSNGRIRAFEAFFDSPDHLDFDHLHLHALSEEQVVDLHPESLDAIKRVDNGHFFFIFMCNHVFGDGAFAATCVFGDVESGIP